MRRTYILLLPFAVLAGCASDIRSIRPEFIVDSELSPKDVAMCIADAWNRSSTPVTMREGSGGYTVAWINRDYGYIAMLVDIDKKVQGGSVTVYRRNIVLGVGDEHEAAIRSCQVKN